MYSLQKARLKAALERARSDRRLNSFEREFNTADPTGRSRNPSAISIAPQPGGDFFVDQFTVSVLTYYFTVVTGTYTNVAASAIAASLKTKLAAFIFGHSDFAAGFAKAQSLLPVNIWSYEAPQVYKGVGSVSTSLGTLDSNARAFLLLGDVIQPFTASTAGPVYTTALVVMRLQNGFYSNMLDSLASDLFSINKLRYQLADNTLVSQFSNPIQLINQSLFGAAKTDNVTPTSYKQPQQFQAGIIDIGISQEFNKAIGWGIYTNYNCVEYQLDFFVDKTTRFR
jgi:hypothetical protein